MSVENIVICSRARMPSPARWQQAISEAGFPLRLPAEFDVLGSAGYVECRDGALECGFDYFCEPLDQEWLQDLDLALPARYDCVACLATQTSYEDASASCAAAGALAALTGGVLLEGGENPPITAGDALEWARRTFNELRDLKRREAESEALAAQLASDPEQATAALGRTLSSLCGQRIQQLTTLEGSPLLGVSLSNGVTARGKRWQLDTPDAGSIVSPPSSVRRARKCVEVDAAAAYLAQRLSGIRVRYAELASQRDLTLWFENGARLKLQQGAPLQSWELRTEQLSFEFVDGELQVMPV